MREQPALVHRGVVTSVGFSVQRIATGLMVTVADDGVGGASLAKGHGLAGLDACVPHEFGSRAGRDRLERRKQRPPLALIRLELGKGIVGHRGSFRVEVSALFASASTMAKRS